MERFRDILPSVSPGMCLALNLKQLSTEGWCCCLPAGWGALWSPLVPFTEEDGLCWDVSPELLTGQHTHSIKYFLLCSQSGT